MDARINGLEKEECMGVAYTIMQPANNYAIGVRALKDSLIGTQFHPGHLSTAGKIRPFTFREIMKARLEDYYTKNDCFVNERTEEDRFRLFSTWLDSCTGVAYKAGSTKFKIIPQCMELIGINSWFNKPSLPVSYAAMAGTELDSRYGKYYVLLEKDEVLEHPGWLAAVEEDKNLLKDYTELAFSLLEGKFNLGRGMNFFVRQNPEQDQLMALFVNGLDDYSYAGGGNGLDDKSIFLRAITNTSEARAQIVSIANNGGK